MHFKELNCSSAKDSQMDLIISICASRSRIPYQEIDHKWISSQHSDQLEGMCEWIFWTTISGIHICRGEETGNTAMQFWILKRLTKASASEEAVSFFKLFCYIVYHSTLVALAQIILSFFKCWNFQKLLFTKEPFFHERKWSIFWNIWDLFFLEMESS
jgi:hypothetical protein